MVTHPIMWRQELRHDFYDGQNTVMFEYNGTAYTTVTDRDLSGTMSTAESTVTPDPIAIPITPPFHYAHEWIIGAASPPDTNALHQPSASSQALLILQQHRKTVPGV